MRNTVIATTAIFVFAACAAAQDDILQKLHLQIHGNLAEGVLYGSGNNYLAADTTDGTGKWDEGTLSIMSVVNDHFRFGAQGTSWLLGELGRQNVELDWAYADYKFSSWFGVRAGQVKTPFGLYNDIQGVDAVSPWAFLPEAMYPADLRSFTLSHQGGVLYGDIPIGKHGGAISWSAFGGRRAQRRNEGYYLILASEGISLGDTSGTIAGGDVRWKTPLDGLLIGAAYFSSTLSAPNATIGPFPLPQTTDLVQKQIYAQFERGKWALSVEGRVSPVRSTVGPTPPIDDGVHSWYAMASYRATSKLTLGSYYDQERFLPPGADNASPANFFKDVAVNTRYDFNRFFYSKLEAHYIDGNTIGFYEQVNPEGFQKVTRLLAARVGFTF
ncbi:MAG TPA: hypothetical protein VFW44_13590 [Bryobacteraceae bacterium]|nr:hypothetical protein [Bryobacteraceae bacterium]